MAKEEGTSLRLHGEVVVNLPNTRFRVELENGFEVIARPSGKMRVHYIKVVPGDWVIVELSTYDLTKGRIMTRLKPDEARDLARAKQEKRNQENHESGTIGQNSVSEVQDHSSSRSSDGGVRESAPQATSR